MTKIKVGDKIEVMTPTGRFGLANSHGDGRVYVAFAAGSGITPVLSILRGILARESSSRFFLFYGNRSTADILFRSDLEDMKDRFLDRLSVFHVLSREEQDIPVLNGRLDGAKTQLLLGTLVPTEIIDHAFVCGPDSMSAELKSVLKCLGLPDERVHVERFVSAFGGQPQAKPKTMTSMASTRSAAIIIDGKRREVPVAEGEAILDAALRAGMDLPFACKGGMCCSCRARLMEGTARMVVNYSLEPWEQESGFVLTCQALLTSEHVVVDFDQR
jgi:ring-1,2-phenylacetyl-CoA epoxidase subunit PaaE